MARERKAGRLRQGGGREPTRGPPAPTARHTARTGPPGPAPPRPPAGLLAARRRVAGGARLRALGHVVRPPPVLSYLDRGLRPAPEARVAGVVVGAGGLLYPVEALALQSRGASLGLRDRERLVVVRHQRDVLADRTFHRPDYLHVRVY